MNLIYALLSRPWGGLVIAVLVAVVGWCIARGALRLGRPRIRFVGYAVYGLAALLAVGGIVAIVQSAAVASKYPPMGKRVDVGGYRMHILAEGEARGRPTLVWIPGGHGSGIGFYGHHKVMRAETRSILFDRPGTGWSDPGPFPRSTAREAEELAMLLDKAGEKGPFIFVGHSYGGLLSANYARRNPKKIAAVVLLDPTPPDTVIYTPGGKGEALKPMVMMGRISGLLGAFGIKYDPYASIAKVNKDIARVFEHYRTVLGEDAWNAFVAQNVNPASGWASASIFSELGPERLAQSAGELMVYDGELGDMPVYLVTPQPSQKEREQMLAQIKQMAMPGADDGERFLNFMDRTRLRYLATSTRSQHIITPAGTSHNFPYEEPEFVLNVVRRALAETSPAQ